MSALHVPGIHLDSHIHSCSSSLLGGLASLEGKRPGRAQVNIYAYAIEHQVDLRPWQPNPQSLSCVDVLQLLFLDVGVNNITGTLPRSWSNLTQASTITATLAVMLSSMHMPMSRQSSHHARIAVALR